MKRMLKITMIIVILLLAATVVFAGGKQEGGKSGGSGTPTEIPEGLQIAYFVSTLDNGYHQADSGWAIKYAKEEYGADVQVMDGKSDNNVMAELCDEVVATGYDMCSFFVWEGETVQDTVREAIDNGTVSASFYQRCGNVEMPHVAISEKEAAFQMGKVAAEKWMEFHPDKPIVYAVIGWMENPVVEVERTQPFIEGVKSVAPNAKEAALLDAAAGTEKAYQVCQDLLQAHPEVNIIYSEAANLTLGVLPALEEAGRGKAVNGVCETEILVSTDAPETELRDIYDPNKSLKVTMGLTPKDNAIARIDNLMDIYLGKVPQNEFLLIETFDKQIDYWNTSASEAAEWFNEQYDGNITLD